MVLGECLVFRLQGMCVRARGREGFGVRVGRPGTAGPGISRPAAPRAAPPPSSAAGSVVRVLHFGVEVVYCSVKGHLL